MKQYTTPGQTAKLIELGFERPKMSAPKLEWENGEPKFVPQYTIGELIEMLPKTITNGGFENELHLYINLYINQGDWLVEYSDFMGELYATMRKELVDALYEMVVKLKEEGVI